MLAYHAAFWFAAAMASVVLTLGVIGIALWSSDRRTAAEGGLAAVLTLALGAMFTLAISCLGLRRDFARPLTAVVLMALLFTGLLALLALRLGAESRRPPGSPSNEWSQAD